MGNDYDKIADVYDTLFQSEQDKRLDELFIQLASAEGNILDIGCGTGLYLDRANPMRQQAIYDRYIGIDTSRAMLDVCKVKHPKARLIHGSVLEYRELDTWPDTVLLLYGVGSYLTDEEMSAVLSSGAGRFFMTFYADGYNPVTHKLTGISPTIYRNNVPGLPSITISNYNVVAYGTVFH